MTGGLPPISWRQASWGSRLELCFFCNWTLKLAPHVQVGLSVLPAQLCLRQAAGVCVGSGTPFGYNCIGGRSKYENSFDQLAGLKTAQAYRSMSRFWPSVQATCWSQSEPVMYFSVVRLSFVSFFVSLFFVFNCVPWMRNAVPWGVY
jgi:hypothetical protein